VRDRSVPRHAVRVLMSAEILRVKPDAAPKSADAFRRVELLSRYGKQIAADFFDIDGAFDSLHRVGVKPDFLPFSRIFTGS